MIFWRFAALPIWYEKASGGAFVCQSDMLLADQENIKLILIAYNTVTSLGLAHAQRRFRVPIIGVVGPGARAATRASRKRAIGVLGTEVTVESGAYDNRIHSLDAGAKGFSMPAPGFVQLAEKQFAEYASASYVETNRVEALRFAEKNTKPVLSNGVDAIVLGCTHFLLAHDVIKAVVCPSTRIVSSDVDAAKDVARTLKERGQLSAGGNYSTKLFTSSKYPEQFAVAASMILGIRGLKAKSLSFDGVNAISEGEGK